MLDIYKLATINMKVLLVIFIISFIISSCNSSGDKKNVGITENHHTGFDNSQQQKDTFSIHIDSLHQVELKGLEIDSFEFSKFYEANNSYHLIYHEKGKIKTDDYQFGLSVYSVNDTTIRVNLLKPLKKQWIKCDSLNLFNVNFSPVMFIPQYSDFNQNGINDILLIFSQSMSVVYSHGYLILFSEKTEKLTLIKNSLDIPNLEIINGKIISVTHNHPGHESKEYKQTDEYEISENKLVLIKSDKKYKK